MVVQRTFPSVAKYRYFSTQSQGLLIPKDTVLGLCTQNCGVKYTQEK